MTRFHVEAIFGHTGDAVASPDQVLTYAALAREVDAAERTLRAAGLGRGSVVAFACGFDGRTLVAFLALFRLGAVLVPVAGGTAEKRQDMLETAEAEAWVEDDGQGGLTVRDLGRKATHPLLARLRGTGEPGLLLFSSGSTGKAKAALHDLTALTAKYLGKRSRARSLAFMQFDHIGGINTFLHVLFTGGTLVIPRSRQPDDICACIQAHGLELLPASPTFLNLCLLSGAFERLPLPSLRTITYGSEVMMPGTLARLAALMPQVKLAQTYGLTEVGILKATSEASDSLWVKLGGDGVETRVRDGLLEIKTRSAMLGYLNAPSPFTDDGWFMTGDAVEVKGDHYRILGRQSEMINVGGEKVYPAEIEDVIQELPGVVEVAVSAEANGLTGKRVVARVRLEVPEAPSAFRVRLHRHCAGRLEPYKIPQKVLVVDEPLVTDRFKKNRRA